MHAVRHAIGRWSLLFLVEVVPGEIVAARYGGSAVNRDVFGHLIETGGMDLERGAIFAVTPEPLPHGFDSGRVEGMMLGLAVGDALGNTTEGMLPAERR